MSKVGRDPLLAVAKAVLYFVMAVLGIAILGCVLAIPGVAIAYAYDPGVFAQAFRSVGAGDAVGAIIVILLLTIAMLVLVFLSVRLLKQIVDTVAEGDPFVPANARRLTVMAWLTLAVQVLSLPIGALGMWLAEVIEPNEHLKLDFDDGVSGNGLLLVLVLFVLARVFRQGTVMREELDGTV